MGARLKERELLNLALEALKGYRRNTNDGQPCDAEKEIEAELAKPEPEPVAWASPNVIPLRGLKDNHPAILTPFKCEANTVPLYTSPPRQQMQTDPVAWMNGGVIFSAETLSKSWIKIDLDQWTPLYTSPPARKPLSDDEINQIALNVNPWNGYKFARAIEKAHGITHEN